jgi:hypothetical protein
MNYKNIDDIIHILGVLSPVGVFSRYPDVWLLRVKRVVNQKNPCRFWDIQIVYQLHPRFWVEALLARRFAVQNNQEYKSQVWQLVNEAAKLLREQYGATRLGIIGDLVKPEPLNF